MNRKQMSDQGKSARLLPYLFILPFLILYVTFILIPALGILIKSFTANNFVALEIFNPLLLSTTKFTPENYYRLFTESWSIKVLLSTISIAFLSVFFALILGSPIAYVLTRPNFRTRKIVPVRWFLSLPVYLPIIITSFALIWFFGNMGVVNVIIKFLTGKTVQLAYTYLAVVLGTIAVIIPVYVRTISPAFESISSEIYEASLSLGAGEMRTLWNVILPISKPAIISGIVLIFSMTIGMMEMAFLMGGGGMKVLYMPIEIFQKTLSYNPNIPFASAMAAILLGIALAAQMFSMTMLRRTKK